MKKCTKCGDEKSLDHYYFQKNKFNGGLTSWCKMCVCAARKVHRESNPEKIREAKQAYGIKNREVLNLKRKERRKRLRESDPFKISEEDRRRWLKYEYGISLEEFNELQKIQGNVCAICSKIFKFELGKGKRNFGVDHCHSTGKIRGLLCLTCNTSIGLVKENVETLSKMIQYLKFHNGENSYGNKPKDAL